MTRARATPTCRPTTTTACRGAVNSSCGPAAEATPTGSRHSATVNRGASISRPVPRRQPLNDRPPPCPQVTISLHYFDLLCPRPRGAFWNNSIRPSVCPMAQLHRLRNAGCLQLSHRQPPEMCRLRTRPRTDADPPRFLDSWTDADLYF